MAEGGSLAVTTVTSAEDEAISLLEGFQNLYLAGVWATRPNKI